MSYDNFQALYTAAAQSLAGRPVLIRLDQPLNIKNHPYAGGCCYRGADGMAHIDIAYSVDPKITLHNFLHECAHLRKHYLEMLKLKGSSTYPAIWEEEAEELAKAWAKWALRADQGKAMPRLHANLWDNSIALALAALIDWKPEKKITNTPEGQQIKAAFIKQFGGQ